VGDSRQDTDCAIAAGCLPVLIGHGKFMSAEYLAGNKDADTIHVYEDFNEFLSWIGRSIRVD
jgi:phosphoglycolate phosphatase-like HAD superfamily hydrolase